MWSPEGPSTRASTATIASFAARSAAAVGALVLVYFVLPLTAVPVVVTVLLLSAGLILFVALLGWQFYAVAHARHPGLRAAEALAVAISVFLLLFAATYFRWSESNPAAFSVRLTRVDALYFAVSTFATVGFGDVTAVTQDARVIVTSQIVADLLVLGLVVNAVLGVARRARSRRDP